MTYPVYNADDDYEYLLWQEESNRRMQQSAANEALRFNQELNLAAMQQAFLLSQFQQGGH